MHMFKFSKVFWKQGSEKRVVKEKEKAQKADPQATVIDLISQNITLTVNQHLLSASHHQDGQTVPAIAV